MSANNNLAIFRFVGNGVKSGARMFRNDEYTVTRHEPDEDGVIMLSISRMDRTNNVPWRDKQAIKNMIVGRESEAVELFPAESRLMDSANEFWLYVVESPRSFPVGYTGGRNVSDVESWGSAQAPGSGATAEDEAHMAHAVASVQRPEWAKAGEKNMDTAEWKLRRINGWADLFMTRCEP